jgi:hypothetical protein
MQSYLNKQSMFMQNFSSLASTQTDLDTFLTILEENFRIFQENSIANSKKIQTWVRNFIFNLKKQRHAKFQLSNLYSDRLRHIFGHFWRKFQDFACKENSLANSKKFQAGVCNFILNLAKHVHKLQFSSFYSDGFRHIFGYFWRKFQDFPGKLLNTFQKIPNLSMQLST